MTAIAGKSMRNSFKKQKWYSWYHGGGDFNFQWKLKIQSYYALIYQQ